MSIIFELIGHIAISFLPMAIPLSALFAIIYTMNKLSEDSEVVAMRSFSYTKQQLMAPFLIIGTVISLLVFSLNTQLIPYSKNQFKNTIIMMTSSGALSDIQAGQFFTEIPGVTLFAEKVKDEGRKLYDVFIRLKKGKGEQLIMAKEGNLIKQVMGEYKAPSLRLHLNNGNIVRIKPDGKAMEKILFEDYDFPILSGGELPGFVTKDSMRSSRQLWHVIEAGDKRMKQLNAISGRSNSQNNELHNLKKRLPKSKLEFWGRMNAPLQVLIFIIVGFCLGVKKGRGPSKNSGVLSITFLIAYYVLYFAGVSLARKGQMPEIAAVFLPSAMAVLFGSYFYRRLDWYS